MRFWLAGLLLIASAPAGSQVRCDALFPSARIFAFVDELVKLQMQAEVEPAGLHKNWLTETLRVRMSELQKELGPDAKTVFVARLEEARAEKHRALDQEGESREETKERQQDFILAQWTRHRYHEKAEVAGPFLNQHEFFTVRQGKLALYNIKAKDFTWVDSAQSRMTVEEGMQMILSPRKDVLVLSMASKGYLFDVKAKTFEEFTVPVTPRTPFEHIEITVDGNYLILASTIHKSYVYDISSGKPRRIDDPQLSGAVNFSLSRDGTKLLLLSGYSAPLLYDLSSRTWNSDVLRPSGASSSSARAGTFSADGRFVFTLERKVGGRVDHIAIVDLSTGQRSSFEFYGTGDGLFVSADGRFLVVTRENRMDLDPQPYKVFEISTWTEVTPLLGEQKIASILGMKFHPESDMLTFSDRAEWSTGGQRRTLFVVDLNSLQLRLIENAQDVNTSHRSGVFGPDGLSYFTTILVHGKSQVLEVH